MSDTVLRNLSADLVAAHELAKNNSEFSASQEINPEKRLSAFEKILLWFYKIQEKIATSLTSQIVLSIAIGSFCVITIFSGLITNGLSASIFQQATSSYIRQFSAEVENLQSHFSTLGTTTSGQMQQAVNESVLKMYAPDRGIIGSVFIKEQKQKFVDHKLAEPASNKKIRALISSELMEAVEDSQNIVWQSVNLAQSAVSAEPGIIAGTVINIQNFGEYQFYVAFSLAEQEKLLKTLQQISISAVVIFTLLISVMLYGIVRLLIRPLREATRSAQRLAESDFSVRMKVRGTDEIAQLAQSFNKMAALLETQIAKFERMSAVQTQFVSTVSHELRSPVTTIRMASQLLYDRRDELPQLLKRSAELQYDQINNLETLLVDLLEISRYDAGSMTLNVENTDIGLLVREVATTLEPLAIEKSVNIRISFAGETTAEVDSRRIKRIIRNLIVNAIEHAENKPVTINISGNDTAVAVEVQDNGIGLSAEQAEHVFERFWRADPARTRKVGGTGLGLTIAREDVLIHGGSLEVTGELGVGAVFLFTVPKVHGASYTRPLELVKPVAPDVPIIDETSMANREKAPAQLAASNLAHDSLASAALENSEAIGKRNTSSFAAEKQLQKMSENPRAILETLPQEAEKAVDLSRRSDFGAKLGTNTDDETEEKSLKTKTIKQESAQDILEIQD